MKVGDEIRVRDRNKNLYENVVAGAESTPPGWLEVNHAERSIKVLALPSFDDCSLRADQHPIRAAADPQRAVVEDRAEGLHDRPRLAFVEQEDR